MSEDAELRGPDGPDIERAVPATEPTLSELLDDPIVHLVMARDGVMRGDLDDLLARLRGDRSARAAAGATRTPQDAAPAPRSG